MRACKNCKNGIPMVDLNKQPYTLCALIPPEPVILPDDEGRPSLQWTRPPMKQDGWCGQFSLSWRRLIFGHGAT